jgi:hypothetical protein
LLVEHYEIPAGGLVKFSKIVCKKFHGIISS